MERVIRFALLVAALLGAAAPAAAQVPATEPSCTTFDTGGRAAQEFRTGDEFVLKGAGFPAGELVVVSFRQPPFLAELGRFKAGPGGEIDSGTTILRVPADAAAGAASVRVASTGGATSCDLTVSTTGARPAAAAPAAPQPDEEDEPLGPWFFVWAMVLALGALALVRYRYQGWRREQLEREIATLNGLEMDSRLTGRSTDRRAAMRSREPRRGLKLGQGAPRPPGGGQTDLSSLYDEPGA